MKAAAIESPKPSAHVSWIEANRAYLETEVERLRLLLHRRVLWLRSQWNHDPLRDYKGLVISEAQVGWLLTGEDRRAEERFYREDVKSEEINESIAEVERRLAEQKRELMESGRSTALEVLAHLFGLTPFEQNVLLLCLAPALDPNFELLYAYIQDDVTRKYATPQVALALFAATDEMWLAARNSFLPEMPLRRFRLLQVEMGAPAATVSDARPLVLDDRIADYLLGFNRIDERVRDLLRPLPSAPLTTSHHALLDQLQRWLQINLQQSTWPGLNLVGARGVGKAAVAGALCERLGLQCFSLDITRLPGAGPERHEALSLLEREAVLLQLAFYIDLVKLDETDRNRRTSLEDDLKHLRVFLILGSHASIQTEREMGSVTVARPDTSAQRELWQAALDSAEEAPRDEQIEAIIQQFDFGPEAVAQAVRAAQASARLRGAASVATGGEDGLTDDDLWQACRKQAGWHLDELAQRLVPCYTWKDIALPLDVTRQLEEIASQVAHRPQVYETWGFGAKLNRGRGISALFAGPSGTGKTMAAEILANHLNLDLYRIDLAGVVSKYIGETEKNLRRIFDAAEQSGAILFFDEADALFGKRSEVKDSHDRYANIEINYLLQRMEDYRGLAILATNMKSAMDQAFLRRLRFLVNIPFPDQALRLQIWQKVFPRRAALGELDYGFLSRLEVTGGNIKNIALNAAFLAAEQNCSIQMEHLIQAVRREYTKIDKLMLESEFGPYYELVMKR